MKTFLLSEGFTAKDVPTDVEEKMQGVTYHPNEQISVSDLAYLEVLHYNFDGTVSKGELICNKKLSKDLLRILKELYDEKYPIEKIRLADEYGGDDDKIMADNNSSCFNYRVIANTNVISLHGLGRAIDINPLYNPYIVGEKIMPENAAPYADRTKAFEHKIDENDKCYKIFKAHGWLWGGDWVNSKDYQHFYKPVSGIKKLIKKISG